jgi:DNA repair photolyase
MTLDVIYEPKGRAREYAALALNIYHCCPHGCQYCYVPQFLHRKPMEHFRPAVARANIVDRVEADCEKLKGDSREILLCFACDPFPRFYGDDEDRNLTDKVLHMLGLCGMRATVLTKAGYAQVRYAFPALKKYGFRLGVSLSWVDDKKRAHWEPNAAPVGERLELLNQAQAYGIPTWLSIEPVIDVEEALRVMKVCAFAADLIRVGKINHHPVIESSTNWPDFLRRTKDALRGRRYIIKQDLQRAAAKGRL